MQLIMPFTGDLRSIPSSAAGVFAMVSVYSPSDPRVDASRYPSGVIAVQLVTRVDDLSVKLIEEMNRLVGRCPEPIRTFFDAVVVNPTFSIQRGFVRGPNLHRDVSFNDLDTPIGVTSPVICEVVNL
ncbi:MAG: hypothetical protein SP1CHLAM54_00960 [Chlamydiia bacterium]|nr:hypothetical protein [Chlamydiia bacterium]